MGHSLLSNLESKGNSDGDTGGEDTPQFSPPHYLDINATELRKPAACYAHASQSPNKFYDSQDRISVFRGLESGCKYAEAYILQIQSPYDALPS